MLSKDQLKIIMFRKQDVYVQMQNITDFESNACFSFLMSNIMSGEKYLRTQNDQMSQSYTDDIVFAKDIQ